MVPNPLLSLISKLLPSSLISFPLLFLSPSVALTKTKADRKALKEGLVDTVRSSVDKYKNIFIVSFENLRSTLFKDLRRDWADDSRCVPLPSSTLLSFFYTLSTF